jgi:hypothetical protein
MRRHATSSATAAAAGPHGFGYTPRQRRTPDMPRGPARTPGRPRVRRRTPCLPPISVYPPTLPRTLACPPRTPGTGGQEGPARARGGARGRPPGQRRQSCHTNPTQTTRLPREARSACPHVTGDPRSPSKRPGGCASRQRSWRHRRAPTPAGRRRTGRHAARSGRRRPDRPRARGGRRGSRASSRCARGHALPGADAGAGGQDGPR